MASPVGGSPLALTSQVQLCERLHHLIHFSSQLLFIAGESGSGKSTLSKHLLTAVHDLPCVQLAIQANMKPQQIRTRLFSQLLSQPLFNPDDSIADSWFRMLGEENRPCLIVIDDAHLMPPAILAELWMLLQMSHAKHARSQLNVVLFAPGDWVASQISILNQQNREWVVELEVEALGQEESVKFVEQLFRQRGYQAEFANQDALARKIEQCQGNPAALKNLVERIVTGVPETSPRKRRPLWVPLLLASVLACGLLLGLVGVWLYPFEKGPVTAQEAQPEADTQLQFDGETSMAVPEPPAVAESGEQTDWQAGSDSRANFDSTAEMEQPLAGTWSDARLQAMSLPEPVAAEAVVISEHGSESRQRIVLSDDVVEQIMDSQVPQANAMNSQSASSQPVVTLVDDSQVSAAATGDKPAPAPVQEDAQALTTLNLTPVDLLQGKPATHYTLQLSGLSSEAALREFLSQENLHEQAWYYKTLRNNTAWYVVIYGQYPSLKAAANQLNNLPPSLKKLSPWVKSFSKVHNELMK